MENKLAPISPTVNTGVAQAPAWPSTQSNQAQAHGDVADLRLVIEHDEASGSFIYKTIDRRTGDVVSQLPREEVVRMREAITYEVGSLIKTAV
jgi:flagellar protein FlaG